MRGKPCQRVCVLNHCVCVSVEMCVSVARFGASVVAAPQIESCFLNWQQQMLTLIGVHC